MLQNQVHPGVKFNGWQALCGGYLLGIHNIGHVIELIDLNFAFGEDGLDLELPAHRLNEAAQRGDIHIRALLHLRHRTLIDAKNAGEAGLRQAARLPELIERYRLHDRFHVLPRLFLFFRRKRPANLSPVMSHRVSLQSLRHARLFPVVDIPSRALSS